MGLENREDGFIGAIVPCANAPKKDFPVLEIIAVNTLLEALQSVR